MERSEISENLNRKVKYDGSVYKLYKYVAWRNENNGKFEHAVVLLDRNKNSVIQVGLEKVEVIENERI